MKRLRDDQRERRNKRRKQFRLRLQEQEWRRQRHLWRTGSGVLLEDEESDKESEER